MISVWCVSELVDVSPVEVQTIFHSCHAWKPHTPIWMIQKCKIPKEVCSYPKTINLFGYGHFCGTVNNISDLNWSAEICNSSFCVSSVSSTCHALLDRLLDRSLEENFSDQLLPHHLDSEVDRQSESSHNHLCFWCYNGYLHPLVKVNES